MAGSRRNGRTLLAAALVAVTIVVLSVWFASPFPASFVAGDAPRVEPETSPAPATGTDAKAGVRVAEPVAAPVVGPIAEIDAAAAPLPRTAQTVEVTGTVTGCLGTFLCVLAANGAAIARTRLDATGVFRFSAAAPLASATFEVHGAEPRARRMQRERDSHEAGTDWNVGELAFRDHVTSLRLVVESQRSVVTSLLAMGFVRVNASIAEHSSHGAPIGRADFELAPLAAHDNEVVTKDLTVAVVDPSVDVVATWTCHDPFFQVILTDVLPVRAEGPRTSVVHLLASHAVLGRVVTAAGEPCANVRVAYASKDPERPIHTPLRTGAGGELCVLVPPRDVGKLEFPLWSARSERTFCDAAAGSTVTMQLPLVRVRVRLLGPDQKPMRFGVRSACCEMDTIRVAATNPNDRVTDVFMATSKVDRWLEFQFGKGQRGVYLVPPTWFANDATVHDVRLDEFVATGDLVVKAPDAAARERTASRSDVRVRGLAEFAEYERIVTQPESGEWRVRGLPVGEYEVTFSTWGRPKPQQVVIPAGVAVAIPGPW
jgi:hypothetical protein